MPHRKPATPLEVVSNCVDSLETQTEILTKQIPHLNGDPKQPEQVKRLREVRRQLSRFIAADEQKKSTAPTRCAECGHDFRPARTDSRFCSNACRQRAYRQRKGD